MSPGNIASACNTIALNYGNRKEYDKALKYSEMSIRAVPHQILGNWIYAYTLLLLQRHEEARPIFVNLLNITNAGSFTSDAGYDVHIGQDKIKDAIKMTYKNGQKVV